MLRRITVIALLCTVSAYAGFFDDVTGVASDVGDYFSKQFNNVKDLFATSQSELEKNINRVKDLLMAVKDKVKSLEPLANDAQRKTLGQVDYYYDEVKQFGDQVMRDGSAKFEENKSRWQQILSDIFDKGGFNQVLSLLNLKSAGHCTLVAAVIAPVILAFIR